ncbi:MAG TPA: prephenate dehydrogenase [Anaerolineales bacterium]|jgi:prephenate dehydrogenase|nr:prephenate dehydrogenase [Anaerolineales bacterium]|tara:strand:- start:47 stop:946 length:900 start_codon:yes stop_codon:yes gene_type:complete
MHTSYSPLAQRRITIVGLGLMGGSLALALRGKCAGITAVDSDAHTRRVGLQRGVVDCASKSLAEGVARADLLVLAAPVRVILELLMQLRQLQPSAQEALPVLDLGSTKAEITAAMAVLPERFDCIGGHPMCGKETGGLAHADAGLYRQAAFVLTPLPQTSTETLALAEELALATGAQPLQMQPERHDRLVALTSHLPYLLACSLVAAVEQRGNDDPGVWDLVSTGFRDTTRVAASDVRMLSDILHTNREAVREALGQQHRTLEALEAALDGDVTSLQAALSAIRATRQRHFPPSPAENE